MFKQVNMQRKPYLKTYVKCQNHVFNDTENDEDKKFFYQQTKKRIIYSVNIFLCIFFSIYPIYC